MDTPGNLPIFQKSPEPSTVVVDCAGDTVLPNNNMDKSAAKDKYTVCASGVASTGSSVAPNNTTVEKESSVASGAKSNRETTFSDCLKQFSAKINVPNVGFSSRHMEDGSRQGDEVQIVPIVTASPSANEPNKMGKREALSCTFCPYRCEVENKMILHLFEHRNFTNTLAISKQKGFLFEGDQYLCHSCVFKSSSRLMFREHIRCHTIVHPYSCGECSIPVELKHIREHFRGEHLQSRPSIHVTPCVDIDSIMQKLGSTAPHSVTEVNIPLTESNLAPVAPEPTSQRDQPDKPHSNGARSARTTGESYPKRVKETNAQVLQRLVAQCRYGDGEFVCGVCRFRTPDGSRIHKHIRSDIERLKCDCVSCKRGKRHECAVFKDAVSKLLEGVLSSGDSVQVLQLTDIPIGTVKSNVASCKAPEPGLNRKGVATIKAGPATIKAVPATIKAVPATTKAVPATIKAVPATTKAVPATIKAVPATIKAAPATIKAVPATIKAVPTLRHLDKTTPNTVLPYKRVFSETNNVASSPINIGVQLFDEAKKQKLSKDNVSNRVLVETSSKKPTVGNENEPVTKAAGLNRPTKTKSPSKSCHRPEMMTQIVRLLVDYRENKYVCKSCKIYERDGDVFRKHIWEDVHPDGECVHTGSTHLGPGMDNADSCPHINNLMQTLFLKKQASNGKGNWEQIVAAKIAAGVLFLAPGSRTEDVMTTEKCGRDQAVPVKAATTRTTERTVEKDQTTTGTPNSTTAEDPTASATEKRPVGEDATIQRAAADNRTTFGTTEVAAAEDRSMNGTASRSADHTITRPVCSITTEDPTTTGAARSSASEDNNTTGLVFSSAAEGQTATEQKMTGSHPATAGHRKMTRPAARAAMSKFDDITKTNGETSSDDSSDEDYSCGEVSGDTNVVDESNDGSSDESSADDSTSSDEDYALGTSSGNNDTSEEDDSVSDSSIPEGSSTSGKSKRLRSASTSKQLSKVEKSSGTSEENDNVSESSICEESLTSGKRLRSASTSKHLSKAATREPTDRTESCLASEVESADECSGKKVTEGTSAMGDLEESPDPAAPETNDEENHNTATPKFSKKPSTFSTSEPSKNSAATGTSEEAPTTEQSDTKKGARARTIVEGASNSSKFNPEVDKGMLPHSECEGSVDSATTRVTAERPDHSVPDVSKKPVADSPASREDNGSVMQSGNAPKPTASKGNGPKPTASHGNAPKPTASQGNAPKPTVSQGNAPKPTVSQGNAPQKTASQASASMPTVSYGNAPKTIASQGHAPNPTASQGNAPKPTVSQGNASKPTASQGNAPKPTVSQGNASKPTASQGNAPKPTASQGNAPKPTVSQGNASKPTVPQGNAPNPTVSQGNAPKPTVSQDNAPKPTVSQGNAPKPTVSQGNAPKPTASQGNASKPTVSQGNAPYPTVSQGNAPKPTVSPGNAPKPTTSHGNAAKPTASQGNAPKPTVSQGNAPKPTVSQGNAPKPTASQGNAPKPTASQGNAPKPTVSQGNAPKPTASQGNAPKPTVSLGNAPKPTAPQGNGPKPTVSLGNAPKATVSQGNAPKPTVSQGNAPKPTVSQGNAPKQTASQGNAAKPTVSQGSAPKPTVSQGNAPKPTASSGNGPKQTTSSGNAPKQRASSGNISDGIAGNKDKSVNPKNRGDKDHSDAESYTEEEGDFFKCRLPTCGQSFSDVTGLRKHIEKSHKSTGLFPCPYCCCLWSDYNRLIEHIPSHVGPKPYRCVQCGVSYRKDASLRMHFEKSHHIDKNFACTVDDCEFVTNLWTDFKVHVFSYHPGQEGWTCFACDARFPKRNDYFVHIESGMESVICCGLCTLKAKMRHAITRHSGSVHSGATNPIFVETTVKCAKTVEQTQPMGTPTQPSVGAPTKSVVLHECRHCDYADRNKASFDKHVEAHSVQKSLQFAFSCELCPFGSGDRTQFKVHLANHRKTPVRQLRCFKCTHCIFLTNQMMMIEKHLQEMHKERPFKFEVQQEVVYANPQSKLTNSGVQKSDSRAAPQTSEKLHESGKTPKIKSSGKAPKQTASTGNTPKQTTPSGKAPKQTASTGNTPEQTASTGYAAKQIASSGNAAKQTASIGNTPKQTASTGNASKQTTPSGKAPKQTTPSGNAPKQTASTANTPKQTTPSGKAPKQTTPSGNAPKQTASTANTPKQTTPSGKAPKQTTPSGNAPKQTASTANTPKQTTPSGKAPKQTTPSGNAPKQTASTGNTPKQTTPSGNAPKQIALSDNAPKQTATTGNTPTQTASTGKAAKQTTPSGNAPKQTASTGNAPKQTTPSGNTPKQTTSSGNAPKQTTPSGNAAKQTTSSSNAPKQTTPSGNTPKQAASSVKALKQAASSVKALKLTASSDIAQEKYLVSSPVPNTKQAIAERQGETNRSGNDDVDENGDCPVEKKSKTAKKPELENPASTDTRRRKSIGTRTASVDSIVCLSGEADETGDEEQPPTPVVGAVESSGAVVESSGAAVESSSAAVESSGAAVESSSAAVESSSAAVESSSAAVESSSAAVESSGAAVESSSAAVESSSAAAESCGAAVESSSAAVESNGATVESSSAAGESSSAAVDRFRCEQDSCQFTCDDWHVFHDHVQSLHGNCTQWSNIGLTVTSNADGKEDELVNAGDAVSSKDESASTAGALSSKNESASNADEMSGKNEPVIAADRVSGIHESVSSADENIDSILSSTTVDAKLVSVRENQTYQCDLCNTVCEEFESFKSHMEALHSLQVVRTDDAPPDRTIMVPRIESQPESTEAIGNDSLQCKNCPFTSKSKDKMTTHNLKHSSRPKTGFKCMYCSYSDSQRFVVTRHALQYHPDRPKGIGQSHVVALQSRNMPKICLKTATSQSKTSSKPAGSDGQVGGTSDVADQESGGDPEEIKFESDSENNSDDKASNVTQTTDTSSEIKKVMLSTTVLNVKPETASNDPPNVPRREPRVKFYKCIYCDFCSEDRLDDIRDHIFVAHLHRNHFNCVHCEFSSMTKGDVISHCATLHPGNNKKVTEDREYSRNISVLETHEDEMFVGMLSKDNVPLIELPRSIQEETPSLGETRAPEAPEVTHHTAGNTVSPGVKSIDSVLVRTSKKQRSKAPSGMCPSCKECGFSHATYRAVAYHVIRCHLPSIACPYCSLEIDGYRSMLIHIKASHPFKKTDVHYIEMKNRKLASLHVVNHAYLKQQSVLGVEPSASPKPQMPQKMQGDTSASSVLDFQKKPQSGTHNGERSTTGDDDERDGITSTCSDSKSTESRSSTGSTDAPASGFLWKCTTCGTKLAMLEAMRIHVLMQHMNLLPFQCAVCDFGDGSTDLVETHIHEAHQHSRIHIPVVDVVEEKADSLKKQMIRVRAKKGTVSTDTSNSETFDYSELCTIGKSGESVYVCDLCDHKVETNSDMTSHRLSHALLCSYECGYCDHKSDSKYLVQKHTTNVHAGRSLKYAYSEKSADDICDEVQNDTAVAESTVTKKTTPIKPADANEVNTPVVNRGSTDTTTLSKEKMACNTNSEVISSSEDGVTSDDGQVPMYECRKCGEKNPLERVIQHHVMLVHLKYKPYKCNYCLYSHVCRRGVRVHIAKSHAGKPRCIVYKLNKKSEALVKENVIQATKVSTTDDANEPTRSNTIETSEPKVDDTKGPKEDKGNTPRHYRCVRCQDYTTTSKLNMLRHLAREIEYFPFGCPHCPYTSNRQDQVKTHIKTTHSDLVGKTRFNKDDAKESEMVELLELCTEVPDVPAATSIKELSGVTSVSSLGHKRKSSLESTPTKQKRKA